MRLDTGAMSIVKRAPWERSTTAVADAAGKPDVSRGNSFVGVVMPTAVRVGWRRGARRADSTPARSADARCPPSGPARYRRRVRGLTKVLRVYPGGVYGSRATSH